MSHARSVGEALAHLRVEGPAAIRWFEDRFSLPDRVTRTSPPGAVRATLVEGVRRILYDHFFTTGGATPARASATRHRRRLFSAAMSAANRGHGCPEPGWVVRRLDAGRAVAEKHGVHLWTGPDDVRSPAPWPPAPGSRITVMLPKEMPVLWAGFYMALGDTGFTTPSPRRLDRWYLHLAPEAAVDFVGEATGDLNAAGVAFRLKVADDPTGFDRCDPAVLGTEWPDRDRVRDAVERLRRRFAGHIAPRTPALTMAIAPGVAYAEDPGGEESFGSHRCALIAEAVVRCHEQGIEADAARLQLVRRVMAEARIDLDRPHRESREALTCH